MTRITEAIWPLVGLAAVALSSWLLYKELRGHSAAEILAAWRAISAPRWGLAILATALAYGALAWYDQIALAHLRRRLSWRFIGAVSFVTYALGHNIGASVFSGAVVRYRAYSSKGLSAAEVGVVVAFTSITFTLGALLLGGLTLLIEPTLIYRWIAAPPWAAKAAAVALLIGPWLYMLGALLHFRPVRIAGFRLVYPRPPIAARQMIVAPFELIGAAGIIYFALPEASNPGFIVVLGVFLASFSAALISHAPGGLGVLEFTFLKATPDVPAADLMAALLTFRLLYLIAPLIVSLVIVAVYENRRLLAGLRRS
ncbi:MAG: UPF0104 family protein [Pseudomonadota bacterium]|nr:UPF0104 family protein [Pseudomonadota bacterium]